MNCSKAPFLRLVLVLIASAAAICMRPRGGWQVVHLYAMHAHLPLHLREPAGPPSPHARQQAVCHPAGVIGIAGQFRLQHSVLKRSPEDQ